MKKNIKVNASERKPFICPYSITLNKVLTCFLMFCRTERSNVDVPRREEPRRRD